jgi:hypothetical protein
LEIVQPCAIQKFEPASVKTAPSIIKPPEFDGKPAL